MGILSNAASRLAVFLLIGGAIAVGGFLLRDFTSGGVTSGGVTDLKVGDCFDVPSGATTVKRVQHHPCKESHKAELVGLFEYPDASGDPYPSPDSLDNYATSQCLVAFRSYTGRDPITDPLLTLGWMYPTADGWTRGDHGINCYLGRVDEGPMTQSYRIPTG